MHKSIWKEATTVVDPQIKWKRARSESEVRNSSLIENPTVRTLGFNLPRALWTTLNRIRTEQGKCNSASEEYRKPLYVAVAKSKLSST